MFNSFEPFTLYIGATGHRDIPPGHIAALESRVESLLLDMRAKYPHCDFAVLSPLADGADRLCARAALKTGCRLIVPLPMDAGEYKKDFSAASALEFDALLLKADRVFIAGEAGVDSFDTSRGFFYSRAGQYVAEHSHVLIALWDGRETLSADGGGTYETIRFATEKGSLVYTLKTPRPGDALADCSPLPPPDESLRALDALFADLSGHELRDEVQSGRDSLLGDMPEEALSPGARRVMDAFLHTDALSVKYRNGSLLVLRLLSFFGLLLVLTFLLYDGMGADLMLIFYAALVVASFAVYLVSSKRGFHRKYISLRVTAEALRIQFYWGLGGIKDSAFESYTFTQKTELGLVRATLMSLWADIEAFGPVMPERVARLWIKDQLDYHNASHASKNRKNAFNKKAARLMLVLSLSLFFIVAVMELCFKDALQTELPLGALRGLMLMHDGNFTLRSLLKIILGVISAGTAFLANYYGSLALPQQIFNDERMSALFSVAIGVDETDEGAFREMMLTVGRESLIESAGWYVMQRENGPGIFI